VGGRSPRRRSRATSRINGHLLSLGFVKSLYTTTLYVKQKDNNVLIVSLYIDVLLITRSNAQLVKKFKQEMMHVF
jgi:hypothetical protein